jgi:hypothetical protein
LLHREYLVRPPFPLTCAKLTRCEISSIGFGQSVYPVNISCATIVTSNTALGKAQAMTIRVSHAVEYRAQLRAELARLRAVVDPDHLTLIELHDEVALLRAAADRIAPPPRR